MAQPKLVSHTAVHHDWLAFQHSRLHTGVTVRGKLHHDELPHNAGFTAEGDRMVVDRTLDQDVPEDPKDAFRRSRDCISGVTATTGHGRPNGKDGAGWSAGPKTVVFAFVRTKSAMPADLQYAGIGGSFVLPESDLFGSRDADNVAGHRV